MGAPSQAWRPLYPIGRMPPTPDPYATLGVSPSATDAELRAAYRRLVQLHHPDHNGGSAESARRFEEVQEAYAEVRRLRHDGGGRSSASRGAGRAARGAGSAAGGAAGRTAEPPRRTADPEVDARLADLERQVREAATRAQRQAERVREQVRRAAREAAGPPRPERPSDEELGYVTTDDSFT